MHVHGGYYLVSGSTDIHATHPKLPKTFYSLSSCISDIIPGSWGLSWVDPVPNDKTTIQKLKMGQDDLNSLHVWLDKKFEDELFGWPNVFSDISTAREFHQKFLNRDNSLPSIKLLGIALVEDDAELYLNEYKKYFENDEKLGRPGNYLNLQRKTEINMSGHFLGYEVLGETFSSFCSYACNGLESKFTEKFGIILNQYGLINTYDEANKAVEYTISDESGAEPAFWLPWAVYEYPL